jgi:hypothetical protein
MGSWCAPQLLDRASGEWWLAVESTHDWAWCPFCGVCAIGHGRRRVVVRNLAIRDEAWGGAVRTLVR